MKVGDIVYLKNKYQYLVKITDIYTNYIDGNYNCFNKGIPSERFTRAEGRFYMDEIRELKVLS